MTGPNLHVQYSSGCPTQNTCPPPGYFIWMCVVYALQSTVTVECVHLRLKTPWRVRDKISLLKHHNSRQGSSSTRWISYHIGFFAELSRHAIVNVQAVWALIDVARHLTVVFPPTTTAHPPVAKPTKGATACEEDRQVHLEICQVQTSESACKFVRNPVLYRVFLDEGVTCARGAQELCALLPFPRS